MAALGACVARTASAVTLSRNPDCGTESEKLFSLSQPIQPYISVPAGSPCPGKPFVATVSLLPPLPPATKPEKYVVKASFDNTIGGHPTAPFIWNEGVEWTFAANSSCPLCERIMQLHLLACDWYFPWE